MAEIFYDDSADLSLVQRRHVAVLGYGSQGHAHALSLRDSGVDVRVGLQPGSTSREKAESDGLRVLTPAEACEEADLVMVLIPDHLQRAVYAEAIAPSLVEGDALFFAHGLNIRYDLIQPPADVDVVHGGAQGARPPGPPPVQRGPRRADARRRRAGRVGQRAGARAVLRQGHRRHPGRGAQDHVQRGDGDRPVRRAGGAVRRRLRADQGRLRHAGRGGVPAGGGVLRVPARDEADRRPDVRGRHLQDVLVRVGHRRVRRLHPRPAADQRVDPRGNAQDPRRDPGRHLHP